MPLRYAIDRTQRLITTVGSGEVTYDDAVAHQDQLNADVQFDPAFDQLIDLTAVTAIKMSSSEIRAIAERNGLLRTSRIAIVAPQVFVYGISRMLQTYNEFSSHASRAEIFHDLVSAMRYLTSDVNERETAT